MSLLEQANATYQKAIEDQKYRDAINYVKDTAEKYKTVEPKIISKSKDEVEK